MNQEIERVIRLLSAASADWPDAHRLFILREIVKAMVAASKPNRRNLALVGGMVVEKSADYLNLNRELLIGLIII